MILKRKKYVLTLVDSPNNIARKQCGLTAWRRLPDTRDMTCINLSEETKCVPRQEKKSSRLDLKGPFLVINGIIFLLIIFTL